MKTVVEYLKQLDLSETESKIYLALIENGPKRVRELAELVGLKRTTAYLYIDALIDRGLAAEDMRESGMVIIASPPQRLQYLVDQKYKTAKSLHLELPTILKAIKSSLSQSKTPEEETEIKYLKGINGIKSIYDEALKGTELLLYATLSELAPKLPGDENLFENALNRNKNLKIFEIYGDSPEKIKQYNYTAKSNRYFYKFMPAGVDLTAPGILHYDNKVAIINVKGKPNGVVLLNKDYYINSKKLFNFIWKILPEPNI